MTIPLLTQRLVRLAIAAVTVAVAAPATMTAQQGATYEVVASFDGIFAGGEGPRELIQGSDGNFYGITFSGGRFDAGTIFRIDAAGVLTTLHHFSRRDGSLPAGVIQAADGNLYGTTRAGGAFNWGTVFRWDAARGLTTLHQFSGDDGGQPTILIQGTAGEIFGVAQNSPSRVFTLNPGGGITTLHRFDETEGSGPSALLQASDGNLYGTTQNDGPFDKGTVFRLDSSGALTTLHAFSGPDGSFPVDLIQGSDGDFYGVTGEGFDPYRGGTIFKIDAAGSFTTIYRFESGVFASVLIQGTDGSFYGSSPGGNGFLFRFDPGTTPTTIHRFSGNDGSSYGSLIQASDGSLFGTKREGGTGYGAGGTIFRLDLGGTFTVLHHFGRNPGPASPVAPVTQASDGRFYGTTLHGGPSDNGTVFTIEPSGEVRVLHNFADTADGRWPSAGLLQATDGLFYGTASAGGLGVPGAPGTGVVFAIDATGALTTRHTFFAAAPFFPSPSAPNGLIQATDGRLYGTTNITVFRLPLSGPATTLTAINYDSDAPLLEASDRAFYGTTRVGGSSGLGTIFSVNAAGALTTRHSFSGADGSAPRARLIEGLNGSLYGTTREGGTFGYGTVFRFDPAGTLTTLYHFAGFAGGDGANPYAGLLAANDGRLYGTTRGGGAFDSGTIFTIDVTGTITTLHSFAVSDGASPGRRSDPGERWPSLWHHRERRPRWRRRDLPRASRDVTVRPVRRDRLAE